MEKDKNGKNLPHLEITDVALINFNVANSDYQQNSRVCIYVVPINLLVNF